jgi:hypothetical protein
MMQKLGLLAVAVLIAAGGVTVNAAVRPHTAMAEGCYEESCTGQDPSQMGCTSSAFTPWSISPFPNSRLDLRYSAMCEAAWARISGAPQNTFFYVENNVDEGIQGYTTPFDNGWTNMASNAFFQHQQARACVLSEGYTLCTNWY